jgi:hypothetical protein
MARKLPSSCYFVSPATKLFGLPVYAWYNADMLWKHLFLLSLEPSAYFLEDSGRGSLTTSTYHHWRIFLGNRYPFLRKTDASYLDYLGVSSDMQKDRVSHHGAPPQGSVVLLTRR